MVTGDTARCCRHERVEFEADRRIRAATLTANGQHPHAYMVSDRCHAGYLWSHA